MLKRMSILLCCIFCLGSGLSFAADHPLSNAEIVSEVQDKLDHANVSKRGNVDVTFDAGVATLSGRVDSLGVKKVAEIATLKVDEVTAFVDNITVSVDQSTPQQILELARKEIIYYPFYTIFDNVVLEARGDTLTVSGQVTDPFEKDDIGNFLDHVKGVASLTNNLEVLPLSPFDEELRLAVARSIYRDPLFFNYGNQAQPSIHIVVKNGNVTLEGVVDSDVERAKAGADATFAGTYFSLTNNLRVVRQ
jgi:osmotically-inducible protein OsmY